MSDAAVPPLHDLLATARVVALPLVTRFRGIDVREALLFGDGPWAEFITDEHRAMAGKIKADVLISIDRERREALA